MAMVVTLIMSSFHKLVDISDIEIDLVMSKVYISDMVQFSQTL